MSKFYFFILFSFFLFPSDSFAVVQSIEPRGKIVVDQNSSGSFKEGGARKGWANSIQKKILESKIRRDKSYTDGWEIALYAFLGLVGLAIIIALVVLIAFVLYHTWWVLLSCGLFYGGLLIFSRAENNAPKY